MRQSKNSFRHESLQDAETIQDILKSLSKGIAKGKLSFSDEDGEIVMEPEGLLDHYDDLDRVLARVSGRG